MNNVQISKTDSAIVKYGGASAACAGLFLGVMLQFAPKQYEHESAHAPLSDQCQDRSVPHAEISSRFPCSPKEGLEFLETVWQQDTSVEGSAEWPRWRCAWLAGVCADSIGKRQVAKTWMTRFEDSFDACGHPFTDADIHYLTIVAGRFAPEPQLAPALWPVALFGLIGGGDPEPLAQILEEIDKSRKAVTDDDVLEQVRLMSWLLLAGEVIVESEEGTPSAGLLRNAIEAFDEGLSMLADLEKAFVEDPALEQRLTSSPENALVAMRYDAVRVRQTAIQKREALAKEKEFERLDALRELIAVEKSVMKEVGQLSFAMMNHDWNGVLNAGDKALSHIGAMQDIAKKKRDYYLLKEPKAISTNDQWSAIDPAIAPMSNGIVSSVKSMMALASARIAEQKLEKLEMGRNAGLDMGPDAESEIIELLDKSEDLLRRAITKVEDDPADGFDVDNAVAPYVEGLALETRARLSTFAKIGDRAAIHDVKASIEKAKEAFASIRSKFERWGADVTAGFLVTDADRRLEFLASKSAATTEAAEMSRAGRVSDAWALLGDAAEVHDSQELILERADAARRAKRKLEDTLLELDRAEASSLIPQHDLDAAITRAGLVLQEIGSLLAARHPSGPVKVDRGATLAKLKKINSTLRGAIEEAASDSATLPRAWAWLSLCLVYESQVADEQVNAERFVKESQRLAKDALFELEQKKPGIDDWDPGYVEAVVAAQLALGHTAAKMLPSHRDESRLAFAAAIDNSTSLPFNNAHFQLLGSPLLAALEAGGAGGSGKLAQEERALRQMMTRFVEASFALRFGDQKSAADQMEEAVLLHDKNRSGEVGSFDASAELERADGFDVHISLPDSIRAFAAMSQTNAGSPEEAIQTLLSITTDKGNLPGGAGWLFSEEGKRLVGDAINEMQSPLPSFAIALALEEVVDAVDLSRVEEVEPILGLANKAQVRTTELLRSARIAGRYPHIVALNQQLGLRLRDPRHYAEIADSMQSKGDLAGAVVALRAAIRRQPRQQLLWKKLLTLEVTRVSANPLAEIVSSLRKEILEAAELGLLDDFQRQFYFGELSFLAKQYADAALQFDEAAAIAETEKERAESLAKAAIARIRINQNFTRAGGRSESFVKVELNKNDYGQLDRGD